MAKKIKKNKDKKEKKKSNKLKKIHESIKTKKSKKNKTKLYIYALIVCVIFVLFIIGCYVYDIYYTYPTPIINNEDVLIDENNNLITKFTLNKTVKHNKIYCLYNNENEIPESNDERWILSTNNQCTTEMESGKNYFLYLKNENNEIFDISKSNDVGKIVKFDVTKEKIYLAIKGTYELKYELDYVGKIDTTITWSIEDESIATVDENGKVTGVKAGETVLHAKIGEYDEKVTVLVTSLITVRPQKYNSKKKYLPCGIYSKEDNDLLDEILKDRINDAGYKTRAGVVEAARFLALEFPYKIRYFSENGRGNTNKVDGEGRYYHIGLYLDESRYEGITKSMHGPKTWGCQLYSNPSHGLRANGFDCSGFVSWVLLNGGFDVGDIGAGLASHLDLTDYGERTKFNANIVNSGKVKVGDLLSSGGVNGGHIAIIVGEDDKYYYVAESLWTPPNVAVVIIGYDKKTIFNRYYYVMYMDSYYKEDGNLTKLWY